MWLFFESQKHCVFVILKINNNALFLFIIQFCSVWASLRDQMLKNLPVVQATWVWSLGWEDPLDKGMATHSSILAWRIPMDREAECLLYTKL